MAGYKQVKYRNAKQQQALRETKENAYASITSGTTDGIASTASRAKKPLSRTAVRAGII
jgi:hypothetical protein